MAKAVGFSAYYWGIVGGVGFDGDDWDYRMDRSDSVHRICKGSKIVLAAGFVGLRLRAGECGVAEWSSKL